MNYIALNIAFSEDEQAEILTAELADYPFESFETEDGTLKAYIPQERLADCKAGVDALLARYGVQGRYIAIETQNWNAVWESNFPAVDVLRETFFEFDIGPVTTSRLFPLFRIFCHPLPAIFRDYR